MNSTILSIHRAQWTRHWTEANAWRRWASRLGSMRQCIGIMIDWTKKQRNFLNGSNSLGLDEKNLDKLNVIYSEKRWRLWEKTENCETVESAAKVTLCKRGAARCKQNYNGIVIPKVLNRPNECASIMWIERFSVVQSPRQGYSTKWTHVHAKNQVKIRCKISTSSTPTSSSFLPSSTSFIHTTFNYDD